MLCSVTPMETKDPQDRDPVGVMLQGPDPRGTEMWGYVLLSSFSFLLQSKLRFCWPYKWRKERKQRISSLLLLLCFKAPGRDKPKQTVLHKSRYPDFPFGHELLPVLCVKMGGFEMWIMWCWTPAVGWTQHFEVQVLMLLKDICVVLWQKKQSMTIFPRVCVSCDDTNYREMTGVVRNSR